LYYPRAGDDFSSSAGSGSGHRGARALRPENTIPAFEYAIAQGVDALELDLAVTKDNILVVSHDPLMNPEICTGPKPNIPIHELTLAEVKTYDCGGRQNKNFPRQQPVPGTRMPTFEEVLALADRGAFEFNVETKIFPDKPQLTPSPLEFVPTRVGVRPEASLGITSDSAILRLPDASRNAQASARNTPVGLNCGHNQRISCRSARKPKQTSFRLSTC